MSLSNSAKRTVTLITMDVLILAELSYAFAKCFSTTADFSDTFLRAYVPLFVPTIVVAFVILNRIKRREAREMEAAQQPALDM